MKSKKQQLAAIRTETLGSIQALIEPYLYESGYRIGKIGESRAYRVLDLSEPITAGETILIAITEDGVATDAHAGGLVTQSWECVSTDDLLELHDELVKLFA